MPTALPDEPDEEFWATVLDAAVEHFLDTPEDEKFDALIVDEAQDLLSNQYLDLFDSALRGGLQEGTWRLFGDFQRQSLYGMDQDPRNVFRDRKLRPAPFLLTKNCRNTRNVATFLDLYSRRRHDSTKVIRPTVGPEPDMRFFTTADEELSHLAVVLSELQADGYAGREIVVLSPSATENAAARLCLDPEWSGKIRAAADFDKGGIRFASIRAFKGLEAAAVVVTGIDDVGTDLADNLLYTATSRSTDRLYLIASDHVRQQIGDRLLSASIEES